MKQFFFLLAFLPLTLLAQNTIVDSVFTENCITNEMSAGVFNDVTVDSVTSTYNSSGLLISRITIETRIRNGVVTYSFTDMDSLIYDSVANSITTLSGTFFNSVFNPISGRIVVYDSSGKVASDSYAQNYPVYNLSFYYTYLPNNLVDYYFRVTDSPSPNDTMFIEVSYDSSWNKIIEEYFKWDNGAILVQSSIHLQYYNLLNQLISYNNYAWQDSTLGYGMCSLDTVWLIYNNNGQLIEETKYFCSPGYQTNWYSYDVNGNLDSAGYILISPLGDSIYQSCNARTGQIINNVESNINKKSFLLYPNPSSGWVEVRGNFSDTLTEIKVTDLSGRIELMRKISKKIDSVVEIDLSELSSGVYVIQIFDEEVHSMLFVKE